MITDGSDNGLVMSGNIDQNLCLHKYINFIPFIPKVIYRQTHKNLPKFQISEFRWKQYFVKQTTKKDIHTLFHGLNFKNVSKNKIFTNAPNHHLFLYCDLDFSPMILKIKSERYHYQYMCLISKQTIECLWATSTPFIWLAESGFNVKPLHLPKFQIQVTRWYDKVVVFRTQPIFTIWIPAMMRQHFYSRNNPKQTSMG